MDRDEKIRSLAITLRNVRSGQPPGPIQPDGVITLTGGEKLYFKIGGVYLYEGRSFRIGRGIAIRAGKGSAKAEKIGDALDTGSLYLTDKRVAFIGINKVVTIPLEHVAGSIHYTDGVLVNGGHGATPILAINNMEEPIYWDSFNAILEALVRKI